MLRGATTPERICSEKEMVVAGKAPFSLGPYRSLVEVSNQKSPLAPSPAVGAAGPFNNSPPSADPAVAAN